MFELIDDSLTEFGTKWGTMTHHLHEKTNPLVEAPFIPNNDTLIFYQ